MSISEKIIRIARWLSIETFGKTEEEVRKTIVEKVKQPSPPPLEKSDMESFARTIGRMMAEFEQMRREIMGTLTVNPLQDTVEPSPAAEKPKPTTPTINAEKTPQVDRRPGIRVEPSPTAEKPKPTTPTVNVEKTPQVDRTLGIKTDGRPIGEARKEIDKKKEPG